ncbi:MAG TPA: zinc dependent phospholipase C family protein [Dehalococcoidia bacterium]|nr:zinc dependent phospholipase C family protein [Dehalococcoidia bacterium]
MPPIFFHMAAARDLAQELDSAPLSSESGAYYLGATTPDIRVLTRGDRRETHYFDLDSLEHQDSVEEFFRANLHLADADRLDPQTAGFVAGYITHLVLDETYIESMYRPHFGQLSALGGSEQANMMDRLLQYELDRRRREARGEVDEIRDALSECALAVDVGFLDSETLRRWQEVAIDLTRHPPDWERFKFQGGRHLRQAWMDDPDAYHRFLETIPDLLQDTIRHVSTAHVDSFLEQSRERARVAVARYLGCAS